MTAMLAVLVPVILAHGKGLRLEIDARGAELRREIVARIEGALTGS